MGNATAEIGAIALRIVEGSGPLGFYVGAALVILVCIVIVLARTANIFDNVRSEKQKSDFLGLIISQYERLVAIEKDLRGDVDRIEVERDSLKDRLTEVQVTAELMRVQIRRLIDLVTAVRDGRMKPEELPSDVFEAVR